MTAVLYLPGAQEDLDRLRNFLVDSDVVAANEIALLITEALLVLANHPLIGRSAENGLRELVISKGRSGYVALYTYDERKDRALVAAIRHQREAGYDPKRY